VLWLGALLLASCAREQQPDAPRARGADPRDREPPAASETTDPIPALPPSRALDKARVALGASLFTSPFLSGDQRVSCASCHHEPQGWADRAAHSLAPGRPETAVNVPSLFNLQYYFYFNWTGASDSLPDHADSLIGNPDIMGTTWNAVAERLGQAPGWKTSFASVFSDGLSPANVRAALVEYELSLTSTDSPFDRWLAGDSSAISAEAARGYRLFESRGCISCHQGRLLGGNLFQRLGVMREYSPGEPGQAARREAASPRAAAAELGRFTLTGRAEDRRVFRVPSLRNIALTAPYLHDGSAGTLSEVVDIMADYQLGELLSLDETQSIVSFLGTLTGQSRPGYPPAPPAVP
jgi:cytochrome c peroxidase